MRCEPQKRQPCGSRTTQTKSAAPSASPRWLGQQARHDAAHGARVAGPGSLPWPADHRTARPAPHFRPAHRPTRRLSHGRPHREGGRHPATHQPPFATPCGHHQRARRRRTTASAVQVRRHPSVRCERRRLRPSLGKVARGGGPWLAGSRDAPMRTATASTAPVVQASPTPRAGSPASHGRTVRCRTRTPPSAHRCRAARSRVPPARPVRDRRGAPRPRPRRGTPGTGRRARPSRAGPGVVRPASEVPAGCRASLLSTDRRPRGRPGPGAATRRAG